MCRYTWRDISSSRIRRLSILSLASERPEACLSKIPIRRRILSIFSRPICGYTKMKTRWLSKRVDKDYVDLAELSYQEEMRRALTLALLPTDFLFPTNNLPMFPPIPGKDTELAKVPLLDRYEGQQIYDQRMSNNRSAAASSNNAFSHPFQHSPLQSPLNLSRPNHNPFAQQSHYQF